MDELSITTLDKLTPEMLEDIYYAAMNEKRANRDMTKPVIQRELQVAGWQAVLDTMLRASDLEWAKRYLAMQSVRAVDERDT